MNKLIDVLEQSGHADQAIRAREQAQQLSKNLDDAQRLASDLLAQ